VAVTVPTCPSCKNCYNVQQSSISSGGLLINWICVRCNVLFVTKPEWKKMNQYMILRNPETYNNSAPKKFFSSLEEATTVAKKMALEHRDTFYVIKLVRKVSINEVPITVEDL